MLYQLYEAQRSLMEPLTDFAQAASKLYSNDKSPLSHLPMAQRMAAGYDLLFRLGKDYVKPEFGIKSVKVDGSDVVIQEAIALDKPFCELRRFKRFTDEPRTLGKLKKQPVVLIVAPLSGHYATLLRDTVRTMLQDHKVYITDWKNARTVPLSEGEFHLDDYIAYVQEFIRHLQTEYGNCHVVSVCQPTVPVLAAVSLMASRDEQIPLSMTMMGGPIDARKSPTSVNNLAMNKSFEWFENNVIYRVPQGFPGTGRRVYPGFLQHTGFVAMNPDRHATSHYDYFKDLIKGDDASVEAHRKFYDEYNAVLDMDADYYLETIRTVFQDFSLVKGEWDVTAPDGRIERVKPADITKAALLTVEGELDDISGSGQTRAAHDLCTGITKNQRRHLEVPGAGHYGIFSGRRWREIVYPAVTSFILAHDQSQKRAVALEAADVTAEDKVKIDPPKAKAGARVSRKAPAAKKAETAVAPARARAEPAKAVTASRPKATVRVAAAKRQRAVATAPAASAITPGAQAALPQPSDEATVSTGTTELIQAMADDIAKGAEALTSATGTAVRAATGTEVTADDRTPATKRAVSAAATKTSGVRAIAKATATPKARRAAASTAVATRRGGDGS
ncbi:polyhydroxyalkanoate depolymerase [Comamonadaceae bacterium OTU4NAUVB1]|nr:polyhydroxyalkanoate depolymerase [Comamonadaceae bacterium OTU4NAUVB1]